MLPEGSQVLICHIHVNLRGVHRLIGLPSIDEKSAHACMISEMHDSEMQSPPTLKDGFEERQS